TDHPFEDGMILVKLSLCGDGSLTRLDWAMPSPHISGNRSKAQLDHLGNRTRTHGEDVAQNTTYSGRGTLKRLDERWMIVRLDLKCAGPAIADVDDPCIFSRSLQHVAAAGGQALQMHSRGFV